MSDAVGAVDVGGVAGPRVGDDAMAAFEDQVRALYDQMARIVLRPDWAKILDFQTRAPDFVHRIAAEKGLGPPP